MGFNEIGLDERKLVSLRILCDIDSILSRHKINYSLAYGTLIGAARHQGFIPWDDDIDIWVPIDSFQAALSAICEESHYDVLSLYDSSSEWNRLFAKISDPSTIILRKDGKRTEKRGIAVDVFPLFSVFDGTWYEDLQRNLAMLSRIQAYKMGNFSGGGIINLLRKLNIKTYDFLGKNETFYKGKILDAIKSIELSDIIGCPISPYRDKDRYPKKFFSEYTRIRFEDNDYMVCCGWDEVLRILYGDYMVLPPVDQRISNHDVIAMRK